MAPRLGAGVPAFVLLSLELLLERPLPSGRSSGYETRSTRTLRVGRATVKQLRESLHRLLEQREGDRYRLSDGLIPYPEGWRASRPYLAQTQVMLADPIQALLHYPLVTHRGGWPDGS